MGEWSDYFEDFPEENPANDVSGNFHPRDAAALHQANRKRLADQAALDAEIARIRALHRRT